MHIALIETRIRRYIKEMKLYEDLRATRLTNRRIKLVASFIFVVSFIFLCKFNPTVSAGKGTIKFTSEILSNTTKKARFAKVTVASGFEDISYEQALETHKQHAIRHGYPMYIARENAADGMFNKVAQILHILLHELFKPADERVEWLL